MRKDRPDTLRHELWSHEKSVFEPSETSLHIRRKDGRVFVGDSLEPCPLSLGGRVISCGALGACEPTDRMRPKTLHAGDSVCQRNQARDGSLVITEEYPPSPHFEANEPGRHDLIPSTIEIGLDELFHRSLERLSLPEDREATDPRTQRKRRIANLEVGEPPLRRFLREPGGLLVATNREASSGSAHQDPILPASIECIDVSNGFHRKALAFVRGVVGERL